MRKWLFLIFLLGLIIAGILLVYQNQLNTETLEGYFSPVFSTNGKEVYFIVRNTIGITWGAGIEHFTPPAHALILKDHLSLQSLTLESGEIKVVKQWPPSPLTFRHIRAYRNSIFDIIRTKLAFINSSELEYEVGNFPDPAESGYHLWVTRLWDNVQNKMIEKDSWYAGPVEASGHDEWPIYNNFEIIEVPGKATYPSALVIYDYIAPSISILLKNKDFDKIYPNGITHQEIAKFSKRSEIERIQGLRKKYQELLEKYKAEGLSEVQAMLKVGEELENLGYYPRSTSVSAHILTKEEFDELNSKNSLSPLFAISIEELQSGIFPDIEQAIANPGSSVRKSHGAYTAHSDYSNSQKLNEFIDSGGTLFYIQYSDITYELEIKKP